MDDEAVSDRSRNVLQTEPLGTESLRGPLTFREIAEVLGISHNRVVQIEQRALQKLRDAWEDEGYGEG